MLVRLRFPVLSGGNLWAGPVARDETGTGGC